MSGHVLKAAPAPFEAMRLGLKTFEYRLDDREFAIGDLLDLHEFDRKEGFTGRTLQRRVTYKLDGGLYGVPYGYCVLAVVEV